MSSLYNTRSIIRLQAGYFLSLLADVTVSASSTPVLEQYHNSNVIRWVYLHGDLIWCARAVACVVYVANWLVISQEESQWDCILFRTWRCSAHMWFCSVTQGQVVPKEISTNAEESTLWVSSLLNMFTNAALTALALRECPDSWQRFYDECFIPPRI